MGIGTSREDELSEGEYVMKLARSSKRKVGVVSTESASKTQINAYLVWLHYTFAVQWRSYGAKTES